MALRSMTGFGRGQAGAGGLRVEVELGTVNRRQFDVRLSLPRVLATLESRLRDLVHEHVARGSVTGNVRLSAAQGGGSRSLSVDRPLARALAREARRLARELGLRDDLGVSAIVQMPDVLRFEDAAEDTERVWRLVRRAAGQALRELVAMREAEGAALAADLQRRLHAMRARVAELSKLAPRVQAAYRRALRDRLQREGFDPAAAPEVVARELVLFADKSDISEELVRLQSHFGQADTLMRAREPAGRALDFLCQEMFREINTIGSKGNDARVSAHVIRLKTELECVREQVQNVE